MVLAVVSTINSLERDFLCYNFFGDNMEHRMRLVDFAFKAIKNEKKDIEVRLNDQKRQLIKVGDTIVFTQIDTGEELKVKVTNLYKYKSFKELFDAFDHKRFGVKDSDNSSIMDTFYTKEEQKKYGALGIEIKILK